MIDDEFEFFEVSILIRIPVCTLSIIEFDVEVSSNSYDIVQILKKTSII